MLFTFPLSSANKTTTNDNKFSFKKKKNLSPTPHRCPRLLWVRVPSKNYDPWFSETGGWRFSGDSFTRLPAHVWRVFATISAEPPKCGCACVRLYACVWLCWRVSAYSCAVLALHRHGGCGISEEFDFAVKYTNHHHLLRQPPWTLLYRLASRAR